MANNNLINKKPDTNRTQHSVGIYGASGALAGIGPLTNGQLVIGSTGGNAVAASITSTSGTLTITPGAGTIDLATNFKATTSGFLAYKSANTANQTGDSTNVTIAANTEVYDIAGEYDTGTYTFTAGTTGKYYFSSNTFVYNLAAGHTVYLTWINTSNRAVLSCRSSPGPARYPSDNGYITTGHIVTDMDSGDTAYAYLSVGGSTKVVGIGGHATNVFSSFCGWRLA